MDTPPREITLTYLVSFSVKGRLLKNIRIFPLEANTFFGVCVCVCVCGGGGGLGGWGRMVSEFIKKSCLPLHNSVKIFQLYPFPR